MHAQPAAAIVRERFWNAPNTITVLRAAVVPVLLLLPMFPGERGSTVLAWIFIVAAVSDLLDGLRCHYFEGGFACYYM